jgi:hypothetical protein
MVRHNYSYKLYIDDLPSATVNHDGRTGKPLFVNEPDILFSSGIPIGVYSSVLDQVVIFNHLSITILTHSTIEGQERIVGFEVEPMSLAEDESRELFDPTKSDV